MKVNNFKTYLDALTYDKYYQDITCIGFKGYSDSLSTWNNIKDEVKWSDKLVADLGCFHGYFSFQIARAGGKVTGFDKSPTVIATTNIINKLEGSIINTKVWEDSQPLIGKFDVVLIMNVLHHFADPEKALKDIDCDIAIFEINTNMEKVVEKFFSINKRIKSHRENRIILITRKCRALPDKTFSEVKIFTTGIYAGGKSEYARSYANKAHLPYINFDTNFSYDKTKKEDSEDNIYRLMGDAFVIDAIPFSLVDGSTKRFFQYARENDVKIVCCICSNQEAWAVRVKEVKGCSVDISRYSHYCSFYYNILPKYSEFDIEYYDTSTEEYITKDEMYDRISWVKPILNFI